MTDRQRDAWDDERLEAAFIARDQARPATLGLVEATVQRVAAERRPARVAWISGIRPGVAVIVALAVVAVVGGASLTSPRSSPSAPTITEAPSSVSTLASSPARTPGPDTALGLPIMSVSDAVAVRDGGVDDREIAVRGWFNTDLPVTFCPIILRLVRPVQDGCDDRFQLLTQDPEAAWRTVGGAREYVTPTAPAIHPSFDLLDRSWWPDVSQRCGSRPNCPPDVASASIVAIGHFDDRRAVHCEANIRQQCEDRFVVDRVDSIDGIVQDLSVVYEPLGDLVWTIDDIERLDPLGPGDSRLSILVLRGGDAALTVDLRRVEDRLCGPDPAVWLITDLIDGRAVTRTVTDGWGEVDEIQPDGTRDALHAAPVSPHPLWPPICSTVVARSPTSVPRQFVAVVDQTGLLGDASRTSVDKLPVHDMSQIGIWVDPVTPRRIVVRWTGSTCDHNLVLTFTRGHDVVLDAVRDSGQCSTGLTTWAIQLRFAADIDTAHVDARYETQISVQ